MKLYILNILIFATIILCYQCKKEDPYDYTIEYQDGYPSPYAGNWKAIDYIALGDNQFMRIDNEPYDLVTAIDPNNDNTLILDNVYNSNLRVRAFIDITRDIFYASNAEQLEKVNAQEDVVTISLRGEYSVNDEDEYLYIFSGLYDQYNNLFDSLLIIAIRKDGFEDVEEYEFDFIFENL